MKFGETIPKGYILEVKSWENDGDDYDTIQKCGVSIELIDVVTRLFPLFNCKNGHNNGFGNTCEGEVDMFDLAESAYAALNDLDKELVYKVVGYDILSLQFENEAIPFEKFEEAGKAIKEFARNHITGYSEFYDFRVAEELKVYYLPEDVIIPSVTTILEKKNR